MPTSPDESSHSAALRYEIVEAQKARTDLMKYKLVVTAVLGAVAVGIGPASGVKQIPYVVGIIPLVALYVDAVCHHNDIRMLVIGRYLRSEGIGYEAFAEAMRSMFNLERVALDWSSLSLSGGIFLLGAGHLLLRGPNADPVLVVIEMTSGAFGLSLTWIVHMAHRGAMNKISGMSSDEITKLVQAG